MKLQTGRVIKNLAGEELKATEEGEPATVGKALANLLINGKVKGYDSLPAYELAKKLHNAGEHEELGKSDVDKLKEACNKTDAYGPLILGQVIEALIDATE